MTDASIVAEPAYDQVLTLSRERCLSDGMAPPLVVCLVGITGAACGGRTASVSGCSIWTSIC